MSTKTSLLHIFHPFKVLPQGQKDYFFSIMHTHTVPISTRLKKVIKKTKMKLNAIQVKHICLEIKKTIFSTSAPFQSPQSRNCK